MPFIGFERPTKWIKDRWGEPGSTVTTVACLQCGAAEQTPGALCSSCHHFIIQVPEWTRAERQGRKLPSLRALAVVSLAAVLLGGLVWVNYPFIPNPVILLFNQPSTDLSSEYSPAQWPMVGGGLTQSKYVESPSSQPEGRLVRSVDLGRPTRSAPAIVDGVIYVGADFQVLAIDATDGKTIWESSTTGPVHSSPAVAGNMLYLGLLDWRVIALDRRSGRLIWDYKTDNPVVASAAVESGIVYIGSTDDHLYALDAKSGKLIWKLGTGGSLISAPAVHDGKVYVTSTDGSLHIRNSRTGDKRLRFRTPSALSTSPIAANGLVYFDSGNEVFAVDADAREPPGQYASSLIWAQLWIWQFPVPKPPGQAGGRWRFAGDNPEARLLDNPTVTPEALYVSDALGGLYAVDAVEGTSLWYIEGDSPIVPPGLAVGDRIYFGTRDGVIHALDRFTGEVLWELSLDAPLGAQLAFAKGMIFARTDDGKLHIIA